MTKSQNHDRRLHFGNHCPVDHLIAVLRTGDEAEQAVQNLYDAGYTDIDVLEGWAGRVVIESEERAANPLTRAWERLTTYLSDDTDARQGALDALSQEHAIVMVFAPGGAQAAQAERILLAHGAHSLRYCGRWSITELSP